MVADQCLLKPFFDLKLGLGAGTNLDFACLGFEPGTSWLQVGELNSLLFVSKNVFYNFWSQLGAELS